MDIFLDGPHTSPKSQIGVAKPIFDSFATAAKESAASPICVFLCSHIDLNFGRRPDHVAATVSAAATVALLDVTVAVLLGTAANLLDATAAVADAGVVLVILQISLAQLPLFLPSSLPMPDLPKDHTPVLPLLAIDSGLV